MGIPGLPRENNAVARYQEFFSTPPPLLHTQRRAAGSVCVVAMPVGVVPAPPPARCRACRCCCVVLPSLPAFASARCCAAGPVRGGALRCSAGALEISRYFILALDVLLMVLTIGVVGIASWTENELSAFGYGACSLAMTVAAFMYITTFVSYAAAWFYHRQALLCCNVLMSAFVVLWLWNAVFLAHVQSRHDSLPLQVLFLPFSVPSGLPLSVGVRCLLPPSRSSLALPLPGVRTVAMRRGRPDLPNPVWADPYGLSMVSKRRSSKLHLPVADARAVDRYITGQGVPMGAGSEVVGHTPRKVRRPVDRGAWTAKTVKRPQQQPAHPQYANYWAPLTRKPHTMPHSAQPQHTNYWAPRTRKRHQQEHRPQRPTESSDPTRCEGKNG